MIDFGALVLAPSMEVFARPIVLTPTASQPGQPSYAARGVWTAKNVDMVFEDNKIICSRLVTLGVRLSEFSVPPVKDDRIELTAYGPLPYGGLCVIEDVAEDGQGGALWTLRRIDQS